MRSKNQSFPLTKRTLTHLFSDCNIYFQLFLASFSKLPVDNLSRRVLVRSMKNTESPEEWPGDNVGTLLQVTLQLLRNRKGSLEKLSHQIDMPVSWLNMLERGAIPSPGVNRIQYLYEKLSGKKLLP